jgi:tetrapyrrole methylase family protein/MazG family protein
MPRLDSMTEALTLLRQALGLAEEATLQLVPASQVARLHHPPLAPDQPALLTGCQDALLSDLKRVLLNAYPADFTVILVAELGEAGEQRRTLPLAELDQQSDLTENTALFLPADPHNASFVTFQETIAHLRAPEGCPWDREQTHPSLRRYLLEETFEVLETLDAADPVGLAEELGDLLLQIVLHTQIATDNREFRMGQVLDHIQGKMLRRHPHVFGDVDVSGAEEVVTNWEAIKKAEKAAKGQVEAQPSVLNGVPVGLPALAQALTISKRVVRVGFEWPNMDSLLDKVVEEAREVAEASDPAHLETEIGDLLFVVVNLARWRNIDPESALRATNARFTRRFQRVEALAISQGKNVSEMSLAEMDALWDVAKGEVG